MNARTVARKPRWIWLYTLVPAAFLLFWGADLIPESGIWRILAECCAVLAVCILAKAWVSANRVALTGIEAKIAADSEVDSPEALLKSSARTGPIQPQPFAPARARLGVMR
jgi:hypothetical protein